MGRRACQMLMVVAENDETGNDEVAPGRTRTDGKTLLTVTNASGERPYAREKPPIRPHAA